VIASIASTLPAPLLVGKAVVDKPSRSGDAPIPALANNICEKRRPSLSIPVTPARMAGAPPLSAMMRSGMMWDRARYTAHDNR
jgi:hypothetical protein